MSVSRHFRQKYGKTQNAFIYYIYYISGMQEPFQNVGKKIDRKKDPFL
jgi:hypothetical protein